MVTLSGGFRYHRDISAWNVGADEDSVLHMVEDDASKSTAIFLETHFIILHIYEIWRSGDRASW